MAKHCRLLAEGLTVTTGMLRLTYVIAMAVRFTEAVSVIGDFRCIIPFFRVAARVLKVAAQVLRGS